MIRQFINNHHASLVGVGIFTISLMTIMINVNAASADDGAVSSTSLVDILEGKGVLTQGEAMEAKAEAKAKYKHLHLGGRVFTDYAFYADRPGLDLGDGAEIRKARLFAQGAFGDWRFKGQYDFAANETHIKDAYIKYAGFKRVSVTAGNFKEPFSLEEMTSTRYTTFMERGLLKAFVPGRHIGVGLSAYGDFWTASMGAFGHKVGDKTTVDSNYDFTGRVTLVPVRKNDLIVHLGGGISYRLPNSTQVVRFRQQPESHVTNTRLVDTGNINNVDNYISYDLEGATVYGPVSVQGEYVRTNIHFQNGLPNEPNFNGFYVYASWFVTGESRPYSVKKGAFERVHPNHNFGPKGWGALELAARFSQLDLEDAGVSGGREQDVTVGVNWYPHPHVRFMFNWVHVSVDNSPVEVSVGSPPTQTQPLLTVNDLSPDVFQVRAQVDF